VGVEAAPVLPRRGKIQGGAKSMQKFRRALEISAHLIKRLSLIGRFCRLDSSIELFVNGGQD
jgi:hypothetical protein